MTITRSRRVRTWLVAAATAVVAAACGSSSGSSNDGGTAATETTAPATTAPVAGAFPVTIDHAFGATTVEKAPTRVVAWGWGSADAAVALGVVPVAIPFQGYGGDERGVLPWIDEALTKAGAAVPTVLPDQQEPPFEAIAAAKPDLILAVYSSISATDYELLSKIAPTVAYPGEAWATPWRDTISIVGRALGRTEAANALLADIDGKVAAAAAAHPELQGKSVAMVWDTGDTFYVYKPADARVAFTLGLGLVSAPSVEQLSNGDSTFYFTLSPERLGELTSDVLVAYADTPEASAAFLASDRARLLPQLAEGRIAPVVGKEFIAAVSPPTALSLTWGLDDYVAILSKAAAAAG